jgi:hypothetical protein
MRFPVGRETGLANGSMVALSSIAEDYYVGGKQL